MSNFLGLNKFGIHRSYFKWCRTVSIKEVALKISDNFSDETQAEFLNFTNYFILGNLSNLKIWRLPKNAQTLVSATTRAIFYIRCSTPFFSAKI
jgi:hypothetical protein